MNITPTATDAKTNAKVLFSYHGQITSNTVSNALIFVKKHKDYNLFIEALSKLQEDQILLIQIAEDDRMNIMKVKSNYANIY